MSKRKLTPWFSMAVRNPEQPGIYNVSCRSANQTGKWYAHFDGNRWSGWENIRRAGGWSELVDICQNDWYRLRGERAYEGKATWRGLASNPKAKP